MIFRGRAMFFCSAVALCGSVLSVLFVKETLINEQTLDVGNDADKTRKPCWYKSKRFTPSHFMRFLSSGATFYCMKSFRGKVYKEGAFLLGVAAIVIGSIDHSEVMLIDTEHVRLFAAVVHSSFILQAHYPLCQVKCKAQAENVAS